MTEKQSYALIEECSPRADLEAGLRALLSDLLPYYDYERGRRQEGGGLAQEGVYLAQQAEVDAVACRLVAWLTRHFQLAPPPPPPAAQAPCAAREAWYQGLDMDTRLQLSRGHWEVAWDAGYALARQGYAPNDGGAPLAPPPSEKA